MRGSRSRLILVLVLSLSFAGAALAETYTVTLNNGSTFLSRYQPQQSSWDQDTILVLNETGTWVALARKDIKNITAEAQNRGYGLRVSNTTLFVGYTANDAAPTEAGAAAQGGEEPAAPRSYDIQQFVDPGRAGGGLPVNSPQLDSSTSGPPNLTPPALEAPAPAPAAAPPAEAPPQQ